MFGISSFNKLHQFLMKTWVRNLSHRLLRFFKLFTHNIALYCLLVHSNILKENCSSIESLNVNKSLTHNFQDLFHTAFFIFHSQISGSYPVSFQFLLIRLDLVIDIKISIDCLWPFLLTFPELGLFNHITWSAETLITSLIGKLVDHMRSMFFSNSNSFTHLAILLVHLNSQFWFSCLNKAKLARGFINRKNVWAISGTKNSFLTR
jgi:hypothetical protein